MKKQSQQVTFTPQNPSDLQNAYKSAKDAIDSQSGKGTIISTFTVDQQGNMLVFGLIPGAKPTNLGAIELCMGFVFLNLPKPIAGTWTGSQQAAA